MVGRDVCNEWCWWMRNKLTGEPRHRGIRLCVEQISWSPPPPTSISLGYTVHVRYIHTWCVNVSMIRARQKGALYMCILYTRGCSGENIPYWHCELLCRQQSAWHAAPRCLPSSPVGHQLLRGHPGDGDPASCGRCGTLSSWLSVLDCWCSSFRFLLVK
jgi:hypothetical protein